ncbi:MAG: 3-phosphoshikimate 1-carboxyvinyltransferase [Pseudomonadota bacterium]
MSRSFRVAPGGALSGVVRVPGDKSISHRSVMLGALAEGVTRVSGFLEGEDALATMNIFRALGVRIDGPDGGELTIHGVGMHGLKAPAQVLDCGNSGTSMRLLTGVLAGQAFDATLTGDDSLRRRPMRRVAEPLERMGARIETAADGRPPVTVHGGAALHGIDYRMPVASAQVKSALLLAGMYARGRTCVTEPAPTRDHTERMLTAFGYPVAVDGARVCIDGGGRLSACDVEVPADISSAAFFLVGASIAPGSDLTLSGVGINPTRTGVIEILRRMGARISINNERVAGGEPLADLRVRSAPLKGIRVPPELVPLAIDEFPALFVAAACAQGETVVTGAEELRVKESDRIAVMAEGLRVLGAHAEPTPDGMRIVGNSFRGGRVDSHGDHRIAMAFAMAALRASAPVEIGDCANVATSFPGFERLARSVGLAINGAG